ncbi:HAUS augmin-like complex subunit 4 [Argonauta hians]
MSSILRAINDSLPVKLTSEDVESMPEFANLLLALSKRITPEGTSVDIQESIQEAEDVLAKEKQEWLQNKILLDTAKQILIELEIKSLDDDLSESDKEFCESLNESLALAEMIPHLNPSGDPDVSVLGLTSEHLKKELKNHEAFSNRIQIDIENILKCKCINLVQFYLANGKTNNPGLDLAKACQLPALVDAQLAELETEKRQLEALKEEKLLLQEKRYNIFNDNILELQNICQQKLSLQKNLKDITAKYLSSYTKTLHSKLALCNTEIICDTYPKDTVLALKKIEDHIDKELKKVKEKNRQATAALNVYENLGPEYTSKVEEYRKLEQDIESINWSLNRLEKAPH